MPANARDNRQILVDIKEKSSLDTIAQTLYDARLIQHRTSFKLYAKFSSAKGQLIPGPYLLRPSMTIRQIVSMMAAGKTAERKIAIVEGATLKDMAAAFAASGIGSENDFNEALNQNYDFSFLATRPPGASLEGYLYPDTYKLLVNSSAQDFITKMLVTTKSQLETNNGFANPQGLNLHQTYTMASIVELEASRDEDRKLIAGIFYNRLKRNMKLESDPTVNYITGRKATTPQDLTIDSVYNTYKIAGLPPGPICSPSLSTILAVTSPTSSDYLFFLGGKDGKVHYAKTLAEHNQNIKTYL